MTITSRLGNDLSGRYPELAGLAAALDTPVLLDGEIVAFDADGRPSFETLQQRMHVPTHRRQAQFAAEVPVAFMVFDVLWHDGTSLPDVPYVDRRGLLHALTLPRSELADAGVGARRRGRSGDARGRGGSGSRA